MNMQMNGIRQTEESLPLVSDESMYVKNASREVRMGFVRKVYGILTAQLLFTVVIAAPFQRMSPAWIQSHQWMLGVSCAVTFVMICAMSCFREATRRFPTNYLCLFVFTTFEAVVVGLVSAGYTKGSVLICFGITAIIFFGLTIYAWNTKTDFTGLGPYLWGAMLSLMVFGLVMWILSLCGVVIPLLFMLYDIIGILIFVMYIVFDTQLIMGGLGGHKNQFGIDDYVFAALNLYLDIINLFLYILQIIGAARSN